MKFNIIASILVVLSVILYGEIVLKNKNNDKDRKNHEKFLLNEYEKVHALPIKEGKNIPKADRPDLAAIQNYYMTIDPYLKRVPTERLQYAYLQTNKIQKQIDSKALNSLIWEEVNSNMGGRTRALMWDPNDIQGKKAWAGGVTGGLWYNNDVTNQTSAWTPISDLWDNLAISCITYDPNNNDIFYVGTGEAQTAITIYRESSGRGAGIWKTSDEGNTWNLLPSTSDFAYVTDIVVRNESGNSVIYASVVSGVYKGVVHQSMPTDGLYRSDDGGNTWNQVLPNIPGESIPYAPSDIELLADGRIFVGTSGNINGEGGATILFSDTGTLGTWTIFENYKFTIEFDPIYNIPGRVILASSQSNANVIYALIGAGSNTETSEGFGTYIGKYIIRSDDKGANWTEKNIPPDESGRNWASLSWHAMTAAVDPNNENKLFIGGLDLHSSVDGANSWTKVSDWVLMYYGGGDEYIHADQHTVKFKQGSSSEVIFGCDGGVFYTSTANLSPPIFKEASTGYNTLQFYTCAMDYQSGSTFYLGGLQDNGTLLYQGNPLSPTDMVTGGDGAYCFFDINEPDVFITSYYDNQYYSFYGGGNYEQINQYYSGSFISPADYDGIENILYANAMDVSGNYEDQILRISGLPNSPFGEFLDLNSGSVVPFSHVKISPYSNTSLFIGTQSGRLFKVSNASGTPSVVEIGSGAFPPANISCVDIGGSEDTLLVTFSNYGVPSVWQTTDGGSTWIDKSGNLPDMPIRWAIFHPQNSNQAMLATEIGIWTTNELDQLITNWYPSLNGLANVRVDMIKVRDSDNAILAATHGRGFFTTSFLYDPYTGKKALDENKDLKVFPNPTTGKFNIKSNFKINSIEIFNSQGKIIYEKYNINVNNTKIDLEKYNQGAYFIRIKTDDGSFVKKVVLNK